MNVQKFYEVAQYTFGQDNTNHRFNDDFYMSMTEAQNDLAQRRNGKWGFLRTTSSVSTTADTRAASLPSDFGNMFVGDGSIRITSPSANDGEKVTLITHSEYYAKSWDADETGTPKKCWILGDNMNFSPVPDVVYVVEFTYYKLPADVENAKATLTTPARYHELLRIILFRKLQVLGYAAMQELSTSDADINKLLGPAMGDDMSRYGGLTFNLKHKDYTVETT